MVRRAILTWYLKHHWSINLSIYTIAKFSAEVSRNYFTVQTCRWEHEKFQANDYMRLGVVGLNNGYVMSKWYRWIDGNFPGHTKLNAIRKTCLDLLFFAPLVVVMNFYTLSLLGDQSANHPREFLKFYANTLVIWFPMQYINFKYVSPIARTLTVGFFDFIITNVFCLFQKALASYFYVKPPEPEIRDENASGIANDA